MTSPSPAPTRINAPVCRSRIADAGTELSVWPTAQQDARSQRRGRYLPASTAHPAKMLPAIAATAISRYTQPGDLVADPMCGIGTTLVEAIHLGRNAIWRRVRGPVGQGRRRQGTSRPQPGGRRHRAGGWW